MPKLRFVDWNILDDESLKKTYTKDQIIDFAGDLIDSYIGFLSNKLYRLGIDLSTTGSINPKFFDRHRKLGFDVGLKVWVSND